MYFDIAMFSIGNEIWGFFAWYFIYRFIPGASAMRAVPRWYNMLTIPLAIALGLLMQYVVVKGEKFYRFLAPFLRPLFLLAIYLQEGHVQIGVLAVKKLILPQCRSRRRTAKLCI